MVEPSSSLNRAIVTNSTGLPLEAFFLTAPRNLVHFPLPCEKDRVGIGVPDLEGAQPPTVGSGFFIGCAHGHIKLCPCKSPIYGGACRLLREAGPSSRYANLQALPPRLASWGGV